MSSGVDARELIAKPAKTLLSLIKRMRDAINFLCQYVIEKGYNCVSRWSQNRMNPAPIPIADHRAYAGLYLHPRSS